MLSWKSKRTKHLAREGLELVEGVGMQHVTVERIVKHAVDLLPRLLHKLRREDGRFLHPTTPLWQLTLR